MIDFSVMIGVADDTISRLPGVCEITAKKLPKEFPNRMQFGQYYKPKAAPKHKIEQNKQNEILSRKLATIVLDCPLDFNLNDYLLNLC